MLDEFIRRFPAPGGKLFPGRGPGEGLTPRQAHARFQLWKAAADLRAELSIHSFRVGFATAIDEASRDFAMVSRALGHRDFRSTLRYLAPDRDKLVQAIEATLAGVLCCGRRS